MPFKLTITEDADRQFRALPAREQRILEAAILSRLEHQPTTPTKTVKRLRPNPLVEFELRAGALRALYNVQGEEVVILIVGRKVGRVRRVFETHQPINRSGAPRRLDAPYLLGRYVPDGMLLSNEGADLCCQPDGASLSHESLESGEIRLVEGQDEGYVELEGSPDMVPEVRS